MKSLFIIFSLSVAANSFASAAFTKVSPLAVCGSGLSLHEAAAIGDSGTVCCILQTIWTKNILNIVDYSGRTAAEIAAANGHFHIVALLNGGQSQPKVVEKAIPAIPTSGREPEPLPVARVVPLEERIERQQEGLRAKFFSRPPSMETPNPFAALSASRRDADEKGAAPSASRARHVLFANPVAAALPAAALPAAAAASPAIAHSVEQAEPESDDFFQLAEALRFGLWTAVK